MANVVLLGLSCAAPRANKLTNFTGLGGGERGFGGFMPAIRAKKGQNCLARSIDAFSASAYSLCPFHSARFPAFSPIQHPAAAGTPMGHSTSCGVWPGRKRKGEECCVLPSWWFAFLSTQVPLKTSLSTIGTRHPTTSSSLRSEKSQPGHQRSSLC